MRQQPFYKIFIAIQFVLYSSIPSISNAQEKARDKFEVASKKVEKGLTTNNKDTLAQGYFDLALSYYKKGELSKSEEFYQKSKALFEKTGDAEGIAKSSRALAQVQEALHKDSEAKGNYYTAKEYSTKSSNDMSTVLNQNDITRLSKPDSINVQKEVLQSNIDLGLKNKDTTELITNYSRMAEISSKQDEAGALGSYKNAYKLSKNSPEQALRYNQLITDAYLKNKDFANAIETKKQILTEPFVLNSTQNKASEISSLAEIYIQKNEDSTAIGLLKESYDISVKNGHTLEAKKSVEKLDSIYRNTSKPEKSLQLYKEFLTQLPGIIDKDSSFTDNKMIAATEERLKILETEKAYKDALIRKKNILNYWLIASMAILLIFLGIILYIVKKLRIKNKKIALQSLRREMNPHFIFNSLNSINQFIANNNEMEANQYLTKFSTLMRSVMENSKEDFVLFSKETSLLRNYLELERSRFPDKFNFDIQIDDSLYADEQLYIPGMLIQPHLENAIWHGLRYMDEKGVLQLSFSRKKDCMEIIITDNGIGIAESKKTKTANQQQHSGRGITNTLERIKILNDLYSQDITCIVEDKPAPDHGVKVKLTVPLLKNIQHED